ncbi:DUF3159 domain-containing protein [Saccharopolyspora flava]|uniref:Intracellular septation protein A n=1 Tax=Saccharopolyspora flava TaxID=95161 RepID=A0A1I6PP74_9PSEU|nr:DUF3159 domain-containing protein [Saccharopolyspora flava]SFS41994.1 Protein of unknown function [Saccharopolyspora flava]
MTDKPTDVKQALVDGVGGPMGMLYTALPVVVFVTAVPFLPLMAAIGVALAAALVLTGVRVLRGERLSSALGGVIAIAAAGGVAALTGSAKDFFLIGIWASLAGAIVMLVSMLVGRPLTGVIWNLLHGGDKPWRRNRSALRAHYLASLAVTAVFAARFVVKEYLYLADSTGWLAFAKIAMGTPLTALAALVVLWAFRHTTKRITPS